MKFFTNLCLLLSLAACGEFTGQKSTTTASCFTNCSNQSNSQNDKIIDLNSKISGGIHDGSLAVRASVEDNLLTISLPITGASYIDANKEGIVIESINGILKIIDPGVGVTRIELTLPLSALLQNYAVSQSETLPNGEQIPTFKSGEHGFIDVDLNGNLARIYISQGHLGIYIESPFNPYVQVSYPSINKDDQVLGYYTQIPALAHHQGGYFSSLVLSESTLQGLKEQL